MPHRTLARQLFGALALPRAGRSAPRTSDPQSAEISGKASDPPNERAGALEPNVGTLLYLVSLAVAATATVVVFFGLGFFLFPHPHEGQIAGLNARDRGVEIEPRPSDLVPPPDKDAAAVTVQREAANPAMASTPSEAHEVLPPAGDTARGSLPASATGTVAANATFDASSIQEQPGLSSNPDEATLATRAGIGHASGTGIGRHRHAGARKHWAGVWQPGANGRPPPSVSGPKKAWRWIVQSAASVLAALSPQPSR
jgi:hypothetical protein